jgi:hypothetical protein
MRKDDNEKEGLFNDNRKVKDSHQEGISRVLQRKSERNPKDHEGHQGKMGHAKRSSEGFKVPDNDNSPRRA